MFKFSIYSPGPSECFLRNLQSHVCTLQPRTARSFATSPSPPTTQQKKAALFDANGAPHILSPSNPCLPMSTHIHAVYRRQISKSEVLIKFLTKELGYSEKQISPKAVLMSDFHVSELRQSANIGKRPRLDFYNAMLDFYRIDSPLHRHRAIQVLEEASAAVSLYDTVPEAIHALRRKGVKLGVVTNSSHSNEEKLGWFAKAGLPFEWDAFINSCEVGVAKPQPGIYEAALEKLNLHPSNCYFIGHTQKEINGAKRLGMTTVLINPDPDAKVADIFIERLEEVTNFKFDM